MCILKKEKYGFSLYFWYPFPFMTDNILTVDFLSCKDIALQKRKKGLYQGHFDEFKWINPLMI